MIYTVSPVRRCSEFRRHVLKKREHDEEPKQYVADSVMAAMRGLHDRTEQARLRLLSDLGLPAEPVHSEPRGAAGSTGPIHI